MGIGVVEGGVEEVEGAGEVGVHEHAFRCNIAGWIMNDAKFMMRAGTDGSFKTEQEARMQDSRVERVHDHQPGMRCEEVGFKDVVAEL